MEDYIVSAEEAAAILGISGKTLRQRLRDQRPPGARQFPPQHGGNWYLQQSYIEQLAAQRGRSVPSSASSSVKGPTLQPQVRDAKPVRHLRPLPGADLPHGVWSEWIPFGNALQVAPRFPGVYMFRVANEPENGPVYIGMAGERKGNGLRGRLAIHSSGKGAASGLGEHAFDRAFRDPGMAPSTVGRGSSRYCDAAKEAACSAIEHAGLEVRWQTVEARADAMQLENELIREYRARLWNR